MFELDDKCKIVKNNSDYRNTFLAATLDGKIAAKNIFYQSAGCAYILQSGLRYTHSKRWGLGVPLYPLKLIHICAADNRRLSLQLIIRC